MLQRPLECLLPWPGAGRLIQATRPRTSTSYSPARVPAHAHAWLTAGRSLQTFSGTARSTGMRTCRWASDRRTAFRRGAHPARPRLPLTARRRRRASARGAPVVGRRLRDHPGRRESRRRPQPPPVSHRGRATLRRDVGPRPRPPHANISQIFPVFPTTATTERGASVSETTRTCTRTDAAKQRPDLLTDSRSQLRRRWPDGTQSYPGLSRLRLGAGRSDRRCPAGR